MGIGGAGLQCTIVAVPIVLGPECASLACRSLGVGGKFISRRLIVKAKKHYEIRVLVESKLNTITDYVSIALTDRKISDQEFRLILSEITTYHEMKDEIRTMTQKAYDAVIMDEKMKNCLIQRGRDEGKANVITQLDSQ